MTLAHYIDLAQLLPKHLGTHAQNRAFGLEHPDSTPTEQIEAWRTQHIDRLELPRWSDVFVKYHYWIGLIGGVIAFVLGAISGATLLSYSGKAPVNVVYFLALAVGVPLVTMVLAFISMARAARAHNALVHLSPASWMEKILSRFSPKNQETLDNLHFNPRLSNWLVIERAQMMAWWFAFGVLIALLGVIVTQDIAFAWSTTLSVTPDQFHYLVRWIAAPWSAWLPSAVPSVDLIEQSQFFRLGGKLDNAMIHHAAQLGQWWKFLAMATLVYALGLRTLVWIAARIGLRRSVKEAVLTLEGVPVLLEQMNTPVVETTAQQPEPAFVQDSDSYERRVTELEPSYDAVLGWAMDRETIRVILDTLQVETSLIADPGGNRTLEEDAGIVTQITNEMMRMTAIPRKMWGMFDEMRSEAMKAMIPGKGRSSAEETPSQEDASKDVLMLVKSWEPPMMDWVDFLEDLARAVDRITVAPIGTAEEGYRAASRDVTVWSRKLRLVDLEKVVLWQP